MAKWNLDRKGSDQEQWSTNEKNDSAQNYMEHKKLKKICTRVHNGSDA
jgi:hypothetical protein